MRSFVVTNFTSSPSTQAVTFDGDYDIELTVMTGSATASQDPKLTPASVTQVAAQLLPEIYYLTAGNSAAFKVLKDEKYYWSLIASSALLIQLTPSIIPS